MVIDNFEIKYSGKEHTDHLIGILRIKYTATVTDWKGRLYCGIMLEWNYCEGYIDILMPGCIK